MSLKKIRYPTIGLFVCLILLLSIGLWFVLRRTPFSLEFWDFLNNLYLPARRLLDGRSPYDIRAQTAGNAVWFPNIIGLFAPIAYLPFTSAGKLWLLINIVAAFALVSFSLGHKKPPLPALALGLLAFFLFPATLSNLLLGQISLLVSLCMLLLSLKWQSIPNWAAGFLLSLILCKPQLSIYFIPAYLLVLFKMAGFQKSLRQFLWAILWFLVFSLPLFLGSTSWVSDFIANLLSNPIWAQPNLISQIAIKNTEPILVWQIISVLFGYLSLGTLFIIVKADGSAQAQQKLLLVAMALTPLFSPYIWSWDFVLMLPLIYFSFHTFLHAASKWCLGLGFLIISAGFMLGRIQGHYDEVEYWWVSWSLLFAFLLAEKLDRINARANNYDKPEQSEY